MKLFVFGVLASVLLSGAHSQLEWRRISVQAPNPPRRRDAGLGYDYQRDQLVLFGGRPGPMDDTWIFNITSGVWRPVSTTLHPKARFGFVSGVQGNYFYVTMGEGKKQVFFNDIWRFSLVTETWEVMPAQKKPSYLSVTMWNEETMAYTPEGRYGAAGGIHPQGTKIYVHQGAALERYFDTNAYDVVDQAWSAEHCPGDQCHLYDPRYPHARCRHAGAMASPYELVIFGGCMSGVYSGGPCPAGDTWIYNSHTRKWKEVAGCPSPRLYSTLALLPSGEGARRLVLYGGVEDLPQVIRTTESEADELSVLDPDGLVWKRQKTNSRTVPPFVRASASMATASNGVYMFGGAGLVSNRAQNDLWLLVGTAADTENAHMLSCTKHFANWILLHGILMTTGWGVFLTWGAFIARYFNSKGRVWFVLHVCFQVFGLLFSIAGLVCGILSVQSNHFMFMHGAIGLAVMILGVLQVINALCRPARQEIGEPRRTGRKFWEFVHHFGGRCAVALALLNISLGVFVAVVHIVLWVLWYAYLGLLLVLVVFAESFRGFLRERRFIRPPPSATYELSPWSNDMAGRKGYVNPEFDGVPHKRD